MALFDFLQDGHHEHASPAVALTGVGAGNILVACIRNCVSPTVGDGANTYTLRSASADTQIWTAFNVTGGSRTVSVTGTPASGSEIALTALEFEGDATVAFDDESNQVQFPGTFSSAPSGSITTVDAVELLIGFAVSGGPFSGESSGFTTRETWAEAGGAGTANNAASRVTSASGTYEYDPPVTSSAFTRSCIVALRSVPSGASPLLPILQAHGAFLGSAH